MRTLPKREHIAAAELRQHPDVEVFLPRIRFQRPTRTGPAWVTEALFLNYLFARFDLNSRLRLVQAARGVREGWFEAAERTHALGEDEPIGVDVATQFDEKNWHW